jgi:tetratricopeptide (TPR) repeat protein
MRTPAVLSVLAFSTFSFAAFAQTQAKPPVTDPYKNEAIVFEKYETTYRMHADGTGERDVYSRARIQSQGAAQQFGVLAFSYAAANETPQIKFVRVHKADGSTVETPTSDAIDMPAAVSREAPLYSDLKEKHIPVRSLSPGDTLEYEVDTTINKSDAPGQFWGATHFTVPGSFIVLSEVLTLEVPADKYVQVWSPNHKPVVTEQAGLKTYHWDVAQLVPAPKSTGTDDVKPPSPKDPDEDADGRKLPSVAWTTFHSWAELGDWYRSLALTEAQPNDAVRAKADEITKTAKTPDDQMRAIYDFVSMHIRYVGIDFGIGRYKPHAAAEVLANQYGDCKDKDTLLEALLRAKGFSTSPALIGAGIAPVPDVPSPAVFNHVITTVNLPSGRIWLDSTPQAAPFQYLSAVIRDQKALVVPAEGDSTLVSTAATAPYPFTAHFEAVASLDADGKLTGKITASYQDDDEVIVRGLAQNIAPADWDKASQYLSSATGFGGTTSDTQFGNVSDSSLPAVMSYNYERKNYGDWDNRRIVPLFPALEFNVLDSDETAPEEDIQLGAPRTLVAVSHIRVPDGYRTDLPDSVHVKTDFATFDKTYKFDGKEILAERKIVVLKQKVSKADWKQYQAFTKDIGLERESWIPLIAPTKPMNIQITTTTAKVNDGKPVSESHTVVVKSDVPAPVAAQPAESVPADASAQELVSSGWQRLRTGDIQGGRDLLDKAKAKNPNQTYLWSGYAYIAVKERNYEEGVADYSKELAANPDQLALVIPLAWTQVQSGDASGARKTLQQFLDHDPGNLRASAYLASLQSQAEDYDNALRTLQAAADKNPENQGLQLQISNTLLLLHRNDEAAAAAKSLLESTDDPIMLNGAAYTLSETGLDLDAAEAASRKSITALEEKTATIDTAEANSRAFANANMLVASWDTLGWIYFHQGKLDAAKSWILPAWRASLSAEVGDHLGQIYEAEGKKDEAATTYALAESAIDKTTPRDVALHIRERAEKLHAAGAKLGPSGTEALQNQRTYSVPCPADVSGWGSFRLIITNAGVIESQQMTGSEKVAGVKPALAKLKLEGLVPPESKAHLLRSAVVSCSSKSSCQVVLVPDGGLQTEQE